MPVELPSGLASCGARCAGHIAVRCTACITRRLPSEACCGLRASLQSAAGTRRAPTSPLTAACDRRTCGAFGTHLPYRCNVQHAAVRRATCGMLTRDMQCAMCSSAIRNVLHFMLRQHATYNIQRAACSMQHAACNKQRAACNMQRTAGNIGECCLAPFSLRPPTHPSRQTHFHREWRTSRGCTGCHRHYWYSGYSRRAHCALYSSGSTSMNALKHVSTTGSAHVGAPCRGRRRPPAD
jgi:hypothetical protein